MVAKELAGEEACSNKDPTHRLDPAQPTVCAIAKTDLTHHVGHKLGSISVS